MHTFKLSTKMITTVNYHLIKACNFKCKFCYATFNDISSRGISKMKQLELIQLLAESRIFKKINFAGGEPTLVPHIFELIQHAKILGFETSIVTNASKIDVEWVKNIAPYLDILTLSIDSINGNTNVASGRNQTEKTISNNAIIEISNTCHLYGIKLKINTVVSQFNAKETLTSFINQINPFRWKILQATKVEGQNDTEYENVKISSKIFSEYCSRNRKNIIDMIKIIEESAELIQGSYLMVDQLGRFFDSENGKHKYSDKILTSGVDYALKQVNPNYTKFLKREGNY